MSDKTSLGDRMKAYESVTNYVLYRRMPIIVRVDGRAFHTFTRGMEQPYDNRFRRLMAEAAVAVAKELGARIGYVQSDEISAVICPYATYETEPPFAARIQKICSIAASAATHAFIKALVKLSKSPLLNTVAWVDRFIDRSITFDARCFNLQQEEVSNYLLWRQQDCRRNAILLAGQHYIGKKAIDGMNTIEVTAKLAEIGKPYEEVMPVQEREGRVLFRNGEDGYTWGVMRFDDASVKTKLNALIA